jgi:hypothetical protein
LSDAEAASVLSPSKVFAGRLVEFAPSPGRNRLSWSCAALQSIHPAGLTPVLVWVFPSCPWRSPDFRVFARPEPEKVEAVSGPSLELALSFRVLPIV